MGNCLSHDLKTKHMVTALKQAVRHRKYAKVAIHHSDSGLQYCAAEYQNVLQSHQIEPSMTDRYDGYQNALAERVNGILKQEFLYQRCRSFDEPKPLVAESISNYNEHRPHLSLSMNSPEQVHKKPETMLGTS
jgi:transposase InsO family protein